LIEAFVDNINKTLTKFINVAPEDIDLVFSAHGVPVSYIEKGDPYQLHVEETVRCTIKQGGWKSPYTLCYQSKVGPVKWLKPSIGEAVERLAEEGRKHLLIIPATFVSEHIETLHEINIDVRKYALTHGIHNFELMPALNDHPKFIQCLAELVQEQLASEVQPNTCESLWKHLIDRTIPILCPWSKSQIAKNKS
jgi:ferrochelatase